MERSDFERAQRSALRLLSDSDEAATFVHARLLFNAGFCSLLLEPTAVDALRLLERSSHCMYQILDDTDSENTVLRGLVWHLLSLSEWLRDQPYRDALHRAIFLLQEGLATGMLAESAAHLLRSLIEIGDTSAIVQYRRAHPAVWQAIFAVNDGTPDAEWLQDLLRHRINGQVSDQWRSELRTRLQPRVDDPIRALELPVVAQYLRIAAGTLPAQVLLLEWGAR